MEDYNLNTLSVSSLAIKTSKSVGPATVLLKEISPSKDTAWDKGGYLVRCILQAGCSITQTSFSFGSRPCLYESKNDFKGLRIMHDRLSWQENKLAAETGTHNKNTEEIRGSNHRKQEEPQCDKDKHNLTWTKEWTFQKFCFKYSIKWVLVTQSCPTLPPHRL